MNLVHPGPWAPLQAPAGLGDLAELDAPWAHAAHHAAVAILAGAVGDAHTWTRWGYPPPAAYRGYAPPVAPTRPLVPARTPRWVPTVPATPLLAGRS